MAGKTVNKGELSVIFGINERQLSLHQKEGMPFVEGGKRGVENEYNTVDVYAWLVDRMRKAAGILDLDGERAKLAKEQAETARMRNELARGGVIKLDEAVEVVQRLAYALRQKIVTCGMAHADKQALLVEIQTLREVDFRSIPKDGAAPGPEEE